MNSERRKREEEIERLLHGTGLSRETDVAFEEKVRKAAATIVEQETRRIQETERPERVKRPFSPKAVGVLLLVLGAGLSFSMPSLGAMVLLGGIAAIVWGAVHKSPKK